MTSNTVEIRATAWSDGSPSISGAGYGLRISEGDRDTVFSPDWGTVTVELPNGNSATVTLSEAFWRKCSELRSPEIGRWMLDEGLVQWPKGQPPVFRLTQVSAARFRVSQMDEK